MNEPQLLDGLPLWLLYLATVAFVILSAEAGFRIGRNRRRGNEQDKDAPLGAIVAATLALLAFFLAFMFGLAATRFDNRREIVVKESNAIGTAYLRAGMLPSPHGKTVRKLLSEYVDVRLVAAETGNIDEAMTKSDALHYALWAEATAAGREEPRSIVVGLFIQSLNDVIDTHAERLLISARSRIPLAVWLGLYFLTLVSMAAVGYHESMTGSRRSLAILALALAFSAVMLLIADLDRPREGMLEVSQQAMKDLREFIKSPKLNIGESVTDGK